SSAPNLASGRFGGMADGSEAFGSESVMNRRETTDLLRAYYRISDAAVRKRVFELIRSLAPDPQ
ncbi:MAG: hypothetical protein ACREFP_25790, partial [Acetobacteraceae bacterium]